jgi:hypothetical protein
MRPKDIETIDELLAGNFTIYGHLDIYAPHFKDMEFFER